MSYVHKYEKDLLMFIITLRTNASGGDIFFMMEFDYITW